MRISEYRRWAAGEAGRRELPCLMGELQVRLEARAEGPLWQVSGLLDCNGLGGHGCKS